MHSAYGKTENLLFATSHQPQRISLALRLPFSYFTQLSNRCPRGGCPGLMLLPSKTPEMQQKWEKC